MLVLEPACQLTMTVETEPSPLTAAVTLTGADNPGIEPPLPVTVTVTFAWPDPAEFVAVRVYVVVVLGETEADATLVTSPIPESIVIDVAPLTLQIKALLEPGAMADGDATKDEIKGALTVPRRSACFCQYKCADPVPVRS